jgi:hypothetical protein
MSLIVDTQSEVYQGIACSDGFSINRHDSSNDSEYQDPQLYIDKNDSNQK